MKMDVQRKEMLMTYINAAGSLSMLNMELPTLKWESFDEATKKQWAATSIIYNMKVETSKKVLTTEELAMTSKNVANMPQGTTMN